MSKKKKMKLDYSIDDVQSPLDLINKCNNEPEPIFYWKGVEDISFGYVFGPSKVGKTIFCENLAMSLACGRSTFFNASMIGIPKRIFFAAMEENYRNRTKRMKKQMTHLSDKEKELFNSNMIIAGKNFPRSLANEKQWQDFEDKVISENPDVLIIDSFTRIMNDDITNRVECKKILKRLRNFAYDNNLCLIIIHHAVKNGGKLLTMDSMAGNSILSQEADFSIGLNRNEFSNERYLKEVFYRYKETDDMVTVFNICSNSNWLIPIELKYEAKIINSASSNGESYYDLIVNYLIEKSNEEKSKNESITSYEIGVSELKKKFVSTSTIPARSFDYTLSNIVKNDVLRVKGKKGNYLYKIPKSRNLRNENDKYGK